MTDETRTEQPAIPLEVINAELSAKLRFSEDRLMAMATVAYNLQVKCGELATALAERSQEIADLRAPLNKDDAIHGVEEEGE